MTKCPICGGANFCEVEAAKSGGDCWCCTAGFPKGIFELVPEELRGVSCICEACLLRFKASMPQE